MHASLQQNLCTPEGQRFFYLVGQLLLAEHIAVLCPRALVEGTEPTARDADISVIDITIYHIGYHRCGMQGQATVVGECG